MSDSIYKETRNRLKLTRDDVCDKASLLDKLYNLKDLNESKTQNLISLLTK